jgi:hypothetical protein
MKWEILKFPIGSLQRGLLYLFGGISFSIYYLSPSLNQQPRKFLSNTYKQKEKP